MNTQQDQLVHMSDCAVHNGPAYAAEPCDCGYETRAQRMLTEAVIRTEKRLEIIRNLLEQTQGGWYEDDMGKKQCQDVTASQKLCHWSRHHWSCAWYEAEKEAKG